MQIILNFIIFILFIINSRAEEINKCNLFASSENVQQLEDIETDKAIKYCREYVDKFPKNKNYTFQLARAYYAKEDFNNSFSFSKKAVQLGSAEAINLLALHYHYAEGTDENFTKAIELYQKAIEMGNTDALVNLGIMYEEGNDFIKKDLDKALSLYNQASNLGNMTGTFFLAEIYAYGFENIKKDEKKAFKLMELAEKQGFSLDVINYLGTAYIHGIGVPRDINKAIYYLEIAENNNDPQAPLNLGYIYQLGDGGINIDLDKAFKYYRNAHNRKNFAGTLMLAQLYEQGLVDDRIDLDVAFDLYLKAAVEGGDLTAMGIVGDYYKEGKGKVEKNLDEAKKWYLKIVNFKEDDFNTIINNNEVTGKDAILTAQARLEEVEKSLENIYANVEFGNYYALLIGNKNYKSLPALQNSLNDVRALKNVLESQYNYTVEILEDATEEEIWKSFYNYRKLTEKDNLLIYYAGHGELDKQTDNGYWLPIDADPKIPNRWISDVDIKSNLRAIKAQHIMVIADSCFSGKLLRNISKIDLVDLKKKALLKKLLDKKIRVALTSGGEEPVLDSGGGKHSIFAKHFIDILKKNSDILSGNKVYNALKEELILNAQQTPRYNFIQNSGSQVDADYVFVPKKFLQ